MDKAQANLSHEIKKIKTTKTICVKFNDILMKKIEDIMATEGGDISFAIRSSINFFYDDMMKKKFGWRYRHYGAEGCRKLFKSN